MHNKSSTTKTEIGQVYFFTQDLIELPGLDQENLNFVLRIILISSEKIFYERYDLERKIGDAYRYRKNAQIFGRVTTEIFLQRTKYIFTSPLTNLEEIVIRPDLPAELFPIGLNFKWSSAFFENKAQFEFSLNDDLKKLQHLKKIELSEFIVCPFGRKYGLGKPIRVKADNNKSFDPIELLWKLNSIQSASLKREQFPFEGVLRLGYEKGLPTYSITRETEL